MRRRGASAGASLVSKTGPIAMPGETAMPRSWVSRRLGVLAPRGRAGVSLFMEACFHQGGHRVQRFLGVPAFGFDHNFGATPSTQHHQPHDGNSRHALPITQHIHASGIAFRQRHQLGGSAGMQTRLFGITTLRRSTMPPEEGAGAASVIPWRRHWAWRPPHRARGRYICAQQPWRDPALHAAVHCHEFSQASPARAD